MRLAYADPPYLGCCGLYEHFHPDGRCWDDADTHRLLIERLTAEYDGWALSLSAPSLQRLIALCPTDVRTAAWCKTWHQIRPSITAQYAWEPVLFWGGRKVRQEPMVRDWIALPATRMKGTIGAKPEAFTVWMLGLLGAQPDDEFVDLFHGSGAVAAAAQRFRSQLQMPTTEMGL